ncbi:MAG: M28 family peptidase [Bacteroidota bacterium]
MLFWCVAPAFGTAQDLGYARQAIDTLCSPAMHGRGYVQHGDELAANYIGSEYYRHGLQRFGNGYYQAFEMAINTFPGKLSVALNGRALTPGIDFLVGPQSSGVEGTFDVVVVDSQQLHASGSQKEVTRESLSGKFVLLDSKGLDEDEARFIRSMERNPFNAKGIIRIVEEKLTHSLAQQNAGFAVIDVLRSSLPEDPTTITLNVENRFLPRHEARNVIGYVPGTKRPNQYLVFTAHYDHLGRMGTDTYFPGANDNASGTAMLLDLARHYAANPPEQSVVFMAFAGEEAGILGSQFYTEHPLFPLDSIQFLLNIDLMGNGEEGITVVNGSVWQDAFDQLKDISDSAGYLVKVKRRGKARNSDHYFFSEKGVPAFFIYTLGKHKAYHDIYDTSEALPLVEYEDLFRLLTAFGKAYGN